MLGDGEVGDSDEGYSVRIEADLSQAFRSIPKRDCAGRFIGQWAGCGDESGEGDVRG